jgi:hypothetical protein
MNEENPYESPRPPENKFDGQHKKFNILRNLGWTLESLFICFGAMSFGHPYLVYVTTFTTGKLTEDDFVHDLHIKSIFWTSGLIFCILGLVFIMISYLGNITIKNR